ncbi:MAG TPA: EAL domain-containing protein, partial [Nevskia sp.]|nr:EAL domain-containing protein [Nevskia sp.]
AGLAVEHFGIGANSAQLLDHIPANFIKFHPSFTQKFTEKDTQKRLGELVEAAKQRNLKTIVSHVEDAHVMARLWQMGVNFIQGYHVQEPEVVLLASDIAGGRG